MASLKLEQCITNSPKVSIGMPVYNGERFLREALESLLDQTFCDFELIISDNASTDASQSICLEYVRRDSRVRYFRQTKNMGAAANFYFVFEQGLAGKYFMWAACDDRWDSDWLEKLVKSFQAKDVAIFGCYRDGNSAVVKRPDCYSRDAYLRFFIASDISGKCFYSYALFDNNCLRRADFSLMYCQVGGDQIFLLQMLQFGGLRSIHGPVFHYRHHDESEAVKQARSYGVLKRRLIAHFPLDYYKLALRAVPLPQRCSILFFVPLKYFLEQSRQWFFLGQSIFRKFKIIFLYFAGAS